jgi:hypothetical protein
MSTLSTSPSRFRYWAESPHTCAAQAAENLLALRMGEVNYLTYRSSAPRAKLRGCRSPLRRVHRSHRVGERRVSRRARLLRGRPLCGGETSEAVSLPPQNGRISQASVHDVLRRNSIRFEPARGERNEPSSVSQLRAAFFLLMQRQGTCQFP